MFKALFYPRQVTFYTDNVRASVTNSMSAVHCTLYTVHCTLKMYISNVPKFDLQLLETQNLAFPSLPHKDKVLFSLSVSVGDKNIFLYQNLFLSPIKTSHHLKNKITIQYNSTVGALFILELCSYRRKEWLHFWTRRGRPRWWQNPQVTSFTPLKKKKEKEKKNVWK